jgi:hypothetical protein
MKKILFIIDGVRMPVHVVEFACYIASLSGAKLTGLFLENLRYDEKPAVRQVMGVPYVETIVASDIPEYAKDNEKVEENIRLFQSICERSDVRSSVCRDRTATLEELVAESRFADIIIADPAITLDGKSDQIPTRFIKELLVNAECPILVAAAGHDPIEEVVFCYDGSPSAFFAMKQLAYLFPMLDEVKATIVEVSKDYYVSAPERKHLKEWLSGRYNFSDLVFIQGDVKEELFNFLLKKKNILLVMGAYGRNAVSRLFRQSYADLAISSLPFAVFITHL